MKKSLVFSIVAIAAIIIAATFKLEFGGSAVVPVPDAARANALYICPATDGVWDSIANALVPFHRILLILFLFAVIILAFVWGWNFYQNLLQDKFIKKDFTNAWGFTKYLFWAGIVLLTLIMTPNYFRTVHVTGRTGDWVLCEETDISRGARAVRASAVKN